MTKLNTPLRFELIDNSKAQMANASAIYDADGELIWSRFCTNEYDELVNVCKITKDWMLNGQPGPYTDSKIIELLTKLTNEEK